MVKVSGPHHESYLARVSAAAWAANLSLAGGGGMNWGNLQPDQTQVSPVCRVPKIRAPMLRAAPWLLDNLHHLELHYDPKSWITAHHTARKIEGRLNATVSEISVCFGNAGMAFAHVEVLEPDWDKYLPRMTKALLQGCALDASYTRTLKVSIAVVPQ